jgi:hypothetical protein
MNPRYQIFVSSTFQDLQGARERVIYELMRTGFIAVGMEQFHATDEEQMDYIRPLVDQTDYYVVIVKGRYGSLAADGLSYTEKEYHYALQRDIPILAFLFDDMRSLSVQDTDDDPEKLRKFKRFREELSSNRIVGLWKNEDELVAKVKDAVFGIAFRRPRPGWVRGDQALDPQVYKELDIARKKIAELEGELASYKDADFVFPADIAHGSDLYHITGVCTFYRAGDFSRKIESKENVKYEMSWDDIFFFITDMLYKESPEHSIKEMVDHIVAERIFRDISEDKIEKAHSLEFRSDLACIRVIRSQLEALGLITTTVTRQAQDLFGRQTVSSSVCWCLTEKGRRYVSKVTAIRRDSVTPPAPPP